jgi:hypothetical protein
MAAGVVLQGIEHQGVACGGNATGRGHLNQLAAGADWRCRGHGRAAIRVLVRGQQDLMVGLVDEGTASGRLVVLFGKMLTPGGRGPGPHLEHLAALADLRVPGREQRPMRDPPLTPLQAPSSAGCGGLPINRGRITEEVGGSTLAMAIC